MLLTVSAWFSLSGVLFFLAVLLIALFAIIAYTFNVEKWKAYAKHELMEVLYSAFFLVFFTTFYYSVGALVSSFVADFLGFKGISAITSPVDIAIRVLEGNMFLAQYYSFPGLYTLGSLLNLFSSTKAEWGLSERYDVYFVYYFLLPFQSAVDKMFTSLQLFFFTCSILLFFFYLVKHFLESLLWLGLALRLFPPTRRIGGAFLGVVVVLGIFVPLIFSITYGVLYRYSINEKELHSPAFEVIDESFPLFYSGTRSIFLIGRDTLQTLLETGIMYVLSALSRFGLFSVVLLGAMGPLAMQLIFFVANLMLKSFALFSFLKLVFIGLMGFAFLPAFNISLLSYIFRDITSLIGEEVDIAHVFKVV